MKSKRRSAKVGSLSLRNYPNDKFGYLSLTAGGSPSAPVNTVAPAVTGVAIVSQILSCSTGTWTGNPAPTYTYQWQRGGVDIGGATNNTYTLVAADAGQSIRCVVTASNGVGSPVSANSNSVTVFASFIDIANTAAQVGFSDSRLLRGAYYGSPIIRLRRSGDNSESDFGVGTNGLLDTGVIAWVVAGGGTQNAFVVTRYDQSGNSRHATNTTPTEQAQIVSSGSFLTFGTNARPASTYDGANDFHDFGTAMLISGATPSTDFITSRPTGANAFKVVCSLKMAGNNVFYFFSNNASYQTFSVCSAAGISSLRFPGAPFNADYLINYAYNGSGITTPANFSARVNNTSQTLVSSSNVGAVILNNFIGKSGDGSFMQGSIAEFVRFGSNVTANYTALNGNINAFYGIY